MNEHIVQFNLDEESMANLINLCADSHKSPSEIVHDLIQESARAHGLKVEECAA